MAWKFSYWMFFLVSNTVAFPHPRNPFEEQHQLRNPTYVTSEVSSADMIGEIKLYAGVASRLPATWMLCHGQSLSRTKYEALFAAIGESFGNGDGKTTFNLPDLRSRFVMGRDSAQIRSDSAVDLGRTGGRATHTLAVNHLPIHAHSSGSLKIGESGLHTHKIRDPGHNHKFNYGHWDLAEGKKYVRVPIDYDSSWGALDHTIRRELTNLAIKTDGSHLHSLSGSTSQVGNGQSFSILNPYQTLDYIIFTGIADNESDRVPGKDRNHNLLGIDDIKDEISHVDQLQE